MSQESKKVSSFPPWPADAQPCVWMTAELVAYKLCDREYDCERCPFDAAMRGRAGRIDPSDDKAVPVNEGWEFPEDRLYHRSHAWVVPVSAGRVRWGLDRFAARLLGQPSGVVFPAPGSRLRRGRTACWAVDEGELLPLRSPVSGTVAAMNEDVQIDPGLIASRPYDAGWLLEARCARIPDRRQGLTSARDARRRAATQLDRLVQRVSRLVSEDAVVGPTLADGGERLTELRKILGKARYHRLVLACLR